ncbi:MAG: type II toxin-antitoxin system VapC family toxin [Acidimicrobiales bacterium]
MQVIWRAAQLAHDDLLDLQIESWPYEALADRVWKLRGQLTAYDASYVALAELVGAPLVTLDHHLARCRIATCEFRTPPRKRSAK